MSNLERPRWLAVVSYRTDNGSVDVHHDMDEVSELHEIIERGPSFQTILQIVVTYALPCAKLTVEVVEKQ